MRQKQIKIEESELSILTRRTPIFIRSILTLTLIILILIPLAVTFFVMTYGDGPQIGIVFSFILCWGVGFYLLRLVLWNSVGREILTLNPETISYIADYGIFKDGRKEIGTTDLEVEIIYEDEPNKPFGRLRLKSNSTSIETVVQATILELIEVKSELEIRYNTSLKQH